MTIGAIGAANDQNHPFTVVWGTSRAAPSFRCPKRDGFAELIDQWLVEHRRQLRKQGHTAKRLLERNGCRQLQVAASSPEQGASAEAGLDETSRMVR